VDTRAICNGEFVEVCQAQLRDGTKQPGKLWKGTCRVEYGGGVEYSQNYSLLADDGRYQWIDVMSGNANQVVGDTGGALPGQPNTHVTICAAYSASDGCWHAGKWWLSACLIERADRADAVKPNGRWGAVRLLHHP
jgi:hypothetical protein